MEGRVLIHRLRAGELTATHVEALAAAGHPAARAALGGPPTTGIASWLELLGGLRLEPNRLIAGLAAVSRRLPGTVPARAHEALDASVRAPGDDVALRSMRRRLGDVDRHWVSRPRSLDDRVWRADRAFLVVADAWSVYGVEPEHRVMQALRHSERRRRLWLVSEGGLGSADLAGTVAADAIAAGLELDAIATTFAERMAEGAPPR